MNYFFFQGEFQEKDMEPILTKLLKPKNANFSIKSKEILS
jgi:hypothetical protein